VIIKNKLLVFILITFLQLLLQGCATSNNADSYPSHDMEVNQKMADAWREHGDEGQARYFEKLNQQKIENDINEYGFDDLVIDVLFGL